MSHNFLKYDGEWLGNYISQFPQAHKMHQFGSHGLVYVEVPQEVLNPVTVMPTSRGELMSLLFCSDLCEDVKTLAAHVLGADRN